MVTKHMYEVEDIAVMVVWGILSGRRTAATWAASELHDSGEDRLLERQLRLAWALLPPNCAMDAACANAKSCAELLKHLLACATTPHSLPALPAVLPVPPPSICASIHIPAVALEAAARWKRPGAWSLSDAAVFLRAVRGALHRRRDWWHATHLTAPLLSHAMESVIDLVRELGLPAVWAEWLEESTHYEPLTHKILEHMFCSAAASGNGGGGDDNGGTILRLRPLPNGMRAGRLHAVVPEALAAWHVRSKPTSRLMGEPVCVAEEHASDFWQKVCAKHGVTLQDRTLHFRSTDDMDAFYASCFPDDIPDEWPAEERAKSHGLLVAPSPAEKNPWIAAFHLCWT